MRLAWVTDPHFDKSGLLGFAKTVKALQSSSAEALVVTGDVGESTAERPNVAFDYLTRLYQETGLPLYYVLGNHDYYGSSIADVREQAKRVKGPRYLPHEKGPLRLTASTVLVGVDGWGDALNGIPAKKGAYLNDALYVRELREAHLKGSYTAALRRIGRAEGKRLAKLLQAAVETGAKRVLVATHVPPFPEAAWFNGKAGDLHTNAYFTCGGTGEALLRCALDYPAIHFRVLCGHTHGGGIANKCPNLIVRTGAVRMGSPAPQDPVEIE